MKLFKKISVFKTIIVLTLTALGITGCSEYLDVDNDTDFPKTVENAQLLTNIEIGIGDLTDFNGGMGQLLSVYTHQQTDRGNPDNYSARVNEGSVENDWQNLYLNLTDIETLLKQANAKNNRAYSGIAKMLKAYSLSIAVDMWGNVPYTEATKLALGVRNPKYDDQKAVYAAVFALIDEAKADFSATPPTSGVPAADDLFYFGDLTKWKKFANTFKLKLYNQVRLTPDFDTAGFNALIAENNFMTSSADDFQFKHNDVTAPRNERNRLFIQSYTGTQFGNYISPWIYEILKGVNPNIHNGNRDPRMPYYIYNQLPPNALPFVGTTIANPLSDYWDRTSGFWTIRFASNGPYRNGAADDQASFPGIFPAGGRYDDGLGGKIRTNNTVAFRGGGVAPKRILTYDEYLFIVAELIQVGKLPGNASTALTTAMNANFKKVDEVVAGSGTTQTVPVLLGSTGATTFLTGITTEFSAASATKKLEIIMTQKWVATFGDPTDQYNDYRRTGFPILADPNVSPEYQLNNGAGYPLLNDGETQPSNGYQNSLFWPQDQLNLNNQAPAQKNPQTYKIFWDL